MTVRALLVLIDDERPLGPQLKAARVFGGQPLKVLSILCGHSVRHVQRLIEMSDFCDRQAVQLDAMVPPSDGKPAEGGEM